MNSLHTCSDAASCIYEHCVAAAPDTQCEMKECCRTYFINCFKCHRRTCNLHWSWQRAKCLDCKYNKRAVRKPVFLY